MTKHFLATAAIIGALFGASALADIQDPPLAQQDPLRKLGRGLGNIAFGVTELPYTMGRTHRAENANAAFSVGVVRGTWRTFQRVGYGVVEVVTFPFPTYHGTYRQPYMRQELNNYSGLQEFPPELGFHTSATYTSASR